MLIKEKDDCQDRVDFLNGLLSRKLPVDKRRQIEKELKCLHSGNKGEKTSAYYLDLYFKPSNNWALIHDLRLEHKGDVAQIDHLLIGRMLDIYVVESKNYQQGVVISDEGDFTCFYGRQPVPVESPIAQNERHIAVLRRYLEDNELLPKRLGVTIKPVYINIVLMSPTARLTKPAQSVFDSSAVLKADRFMDRFEQDLKVESLGQVFSLAKAISSDSLQKLARRLAMSHKPIMPDYLGKFGLRGLVDNKPESHAKATAPDDQQVSVCPRCGADMVRRLARKGKHAGQEFWGCSSFPACRAKLSVAE